jgi:hypothetical protein
MLGNHDLVRFGDLLQRANMASPDQPAYWARHRLAFMFQGAYTGPITRYYGEEIGDEVPNYAAQVTNNCANLGLCDDHVARTSAKILGVTVTSQNLSTGALALLDFHKDVMDTRSLYAALSHGTRQNLYSDDTLYVDLKTYGTQQIVFAMNSSDQALNVQLKESLFVGPLAQAWDILAASPVSIAGGYMNFTLAPLSGGYILINAPLLLAGDYNHNGVVDASDYIVWRNTLGQSGTALAADGNGNGFIDAADYTYWRERIGATVALGSGTLAGDNTFGTVPEPATLALLIAIASCTLLCGGRPTYYRRCART